MVEILAWNANNLDTFPDSRYKATYLSQYYRADRTPPAGLVRVYPHNPSRGRFAIAHPYLFKWTEKDKLTITNLIVKILLYTDMLNYY